MKSLQTEIAIEDFEVGTLIEDKPKIDPRVVRWGYNPGLKGLSLDPRRSSVKSQFMPIGTFFPITTFETPIENFTMDEYKPKEENEEVLAAEAERNIIEALGVWGFQSLFYSVSDKPLIAAIGAALLPTLADIRDIGKAIHTDEKGVIQPHNLIGKICLGEDENDIGEPRNHCATCHLAWIKSDECSAYLDHVADNGVSVTVTRSGIPTPTTVKPDRDRLEYARATVRRGLEIYIKKAADDWAKVVGELDMKKRSDVKDVEHALRKDLHLPKPSNKEIEAASRMAEQQAEHSQEVFGQLAATTEKLVESQTMTAQAMNTMMQQNQQMMQQNAVIMQGFMNMFQQGGALPGVPAVPPVDAASPQSPTNTPEIVAAEKTTAARGKKSTGETGQ